jgi:transcriptional regulator GlxA family with amidase domain
MQIAIGLYPGLTLLDVIGPYQVLSLVPGHEVVMCAEHTGPLSDDNGLVTMDVTHTFDDVPRPDVLLVGGGYATRALATPDSAIVRWITAAHPTTKYTTSVCTGSLLLGAAGLLRDRRATTHWHAAPLLASFGATSVRDRVVVEDRLITAAGVSAGIDMALTLVDLLHGTDMAEAIQLGIEYDPQPPFDSGAPWKASADIVELVTAVMSAADGLDADNATAG